MSGKLPALTGGSSVSFSSKRIADFRSRAAEVRTNEAFHKRQHLGLGEPIGQSAAGTPPAIPVAPGAFRSLFASNPTQGQLPLDFKEVKDPSRRFGLKPKKNTAYPNFASLAGSVGMFGELTYQNQRFSVIPVPNAFGDYVQAYRVAPNQETVIKGIPNDEILIKVFHDKTCRRNQAKTIMKFMETSLNQYRELNQIASSIHLEGSIVVGDGLHVAKIYNENTALKDQFYIVQYIPHAVDTSPWKEPSARFEDLDLKSQKILREVKRYMDLMQDRNIVMDLKPSNFRLNEETVYLVDFMEEAEMLDTITSGLSQAILMWAGKNQNICDFLKVGLFHPYLAELTIEN